ncbi:MAG: carbamoyltransferase [Myxococcales bacterium]|nr:carbamoyltransferase [Myxococcales bacterium]
MKVLGINFSNDAAAALVIDGEVVGAVQEERLTRVKHDSAFPANAIRWCLGDAGITLADVDRVAFFWNPGKHAEPATSAAFPRNHLEYLYAVPAQLMRHFDGIGVERVDQSFVLDNGHTLTTHFLTHHHCHAAGAFFRSNFERAAILTIDGYGERMSTHIGRGQGTELETLLTVEFPHSLGSFYAAFTQYLGFRANNGEGKVMGLASYGQPTYYEQVRDLITLTPDGFELDLSYFAFFMRRRRRYADKLVQLLGPERTAESELTQRHMDIAASLQKVTEEAIVHLANIARERTGESNLVMSGGVTLNCVANGRVARETGFESCYFMPAASDAGTSMGAALYVAHVLGDDARVVHPENDYLGPQYDDAAIEEVLRVSGCTFTKPESISEAAADLLASGHIVGWMQGRAEFGPRALGSRSILADPRSEEMKHTLNKRVKFREYFRPFAPVTLLERVGEFFEGGRNAPYMLEVFPTHADHTHQLGAITHVDGGARVQTVTAEANGRYYDVVKAFGERTGVPVLVNTSFNIRGEPIVTTVQDALKCFFTTDMDALALGSFLLVKPEVGQL